MDDKVRSRPPKGGTVAGFELTSLGEFRYSPLQLLSEDVFPFFSPPRLRQSSNGDIRLRQICLRLHALGGRVRFALQLLVVLTVGGVQPETSRRPIGVGYRRAGGHYRYGAGRYRPV